MNQLTRTKKLDTPDVDAVSLTFVSLIPPSYKNQTIPLWVFKGLRESLSGVRALYPKLKPQHYILAWRCPSPEWGHKPWEYEELALAVELI